MIDFQAAGGGDGPESVNQALYDAVHHMSWSQDSEVYKVVFLVPFNGKTQFFVCLKIWLKYSGRSDPTLCRTFQ